MSVLINASTSTGLVQSADTSGEIELQSNGTTALKVNTNEGIQILNCLGVGNATPSTSGAGITFPATQSASSDANTLDDYEEGTWTSTITSSGGTITTSTVNRAGYRKIGDTVYFNVDVTINTVGTASGALRFTLPFTSTSSNSVYGREYTSLGYGLLGAIDTTTVNAYVYASTANNGNAFAGGNGFRVTMNGFFQV
jgi:hypothetical protein